MTEPVDPTSSIPPPVPSAGAPTSPQASSIRWARWGVFGFLVAIAAVAARNAAEAGTDRVDRDQSTTVIDAQQPEPSEAPAPPSEPSFVPPPDPMADGSGVVSSDQPFGSAGPGLSAEAAPTPSASPSNTALDRSYVLATGAMVDIELAVGDVVATRAAGSSLRVIVDLKPGADPKDVVIRESSATQGHVALSIEPADDEDGGDLSFFGGHIRLGTGHIRKSALIERVRIEVPDGVHVALETGAGDVSATQIGADLDVETGAGDIEATGHAGRFDATTGAGDVSIENVTGAVGIETGAGDVKVHGAANAVDVETGAGSISVEGQVGKLDLESGMGSIDIRVTSVSSGIDAETGLGSIDVTVAEGGFDLDAESGMGSIVLRTSGQEESAGSMGGELRRTVGGGGASMRLESGGGSIEVEAKSSGSSRKAT